MNDLPIPPTDLRDYAKTLGWSVLPEALKDRLYVLRNPLCPRRQLRIPMDAELPGYGEAALIAAEKLAELSGRPLATLLAQVQALRDDTLSFRVLTAHDETTLPLPFAAAMLSGAEQLLRASAVAVLRPLPFYPRLNRSEAQRLVEATRFRHTEPGSFVLKVSCPLRALEDVAVPSEPAGRAPTPRRAVDDAPPIEETPFVRRATTSLYQALRALISAIEEDRLADLVEQTKSAQRPSLSANLCEALTRFHDEELRNDLELSIAWAAALPGPSSGDYRARISPDYFARIEEVHKALRPVEGSREDTFVGTVEQLAGEMEADGRRAGEVGLALLLPDAQTLRVRVHLSAEHYAEALKAHMKEGAYVQISGRLHPGRQPRMMTDVRRFALLPSPA